MDKTGGRLFRMLLQTPGQRMTMDLTKVAAMKWKRQQSRGFKIFIL